MGICQALRNGIGFIKIIFCHYFQKNKAESIRRYKHFVSKETPEKINQIFGKRNLPIVIGKKSFVDKIKEKFLSIKPMKRFLHPNHLPRM